jgi:hypothetical protein
MHTKETKTSISEHSEIQILNNPPRKIKKHTHQIAVIHAKGNFVLEIR